MPGRNISDVLHPTVLTTMPLIGDRRHRIFFTHLNHTNPLINSVEARPALRSAGFDVVDQGPVLEL